jgi:hypothetical protein
MDDFLAKPVRQEELRVCLERWIVAEKSDGELKVANLQPPTSNLQLSTRIQIPKVTG